MSSHSISSGQCCYKQFKMVVSEVVGLSRETLTSYFMHLYIECILFYMQLKSGYVTLYQEKISILEGHLNDVTGLSLWPSS